MLSLAFIFLFAAMVGYALHPAVTVAAVVGIVASLFRR